MILISFLGSTFCLFEEMQYNDIISEINGVLPIISNENYELRKYII